MVDARNIIGIVGNVISFGLFLSPSPTIYNIIKNKSVEEYRVDPYLATLMNCVMWVIYGLPQVNPDHLLVITINGVGLGFEIIYISIFAYSTPSGGVSLGYKKITGILTIEALFTLVITMVTFFALHTTKDRTILMGVLCVVFNIMMYLSPLTVMKQVITTKSVKYMPFALSLTNFLNGVCWTAYACIKFDPWMVISNGLGTLSGILQLVLYAMYYRKGGPSPPGELELKPEP